MSGLRHLGREIPFSEKAARPPSRAIVRYVLVPLLVVLVALAGLQWFRPLPAPRFVSALGSSVRLPGTPPRFPWPVEGSAAMAIEGLGQLGTSGTTTPVPISGLVKVMTAYVVLRDHPIPAGSLGPDITVTSATLAAESAEVASQQAVVPVLPGESLSEYNALAGILVASGNDLAVLLADWDAGSTTAFVAKMNATASRLGMGRTHFVDPTGTATGSVSTPSDLIKLGEAALRIPAFRTLVAMPQASFPFVGVVYNLDTNLGQSGFLGIKTGADAASGGSYLFAAERAVDSRQVVVVGAVLDQRYTAPTTAALYVGYLLATAALGDVSASPLFSSGPAVGHLIAPWGSRVPVVAAGAVPPIVGIPGMPVPVHFSLDPLRPGLAEGAPVGLLHVKSGAQSVGVDLVTGGRLSGPSPWWRLTRL